MWCSNTLGWEARHLNAIICIFLCEYRSEEAHRKIKAERYDLDVQKDEVYQYESDNEDAEIEDNGGDESDGDDEFYGY